MIDRRPALIAQCAGTADVMAAVTFARDHDLLIAVRGGGHNVAGNAVCDDGLVIDLSRMNAVYVDPDTRTARVDGGATLGDLDHEAQAFGLATTGGIVSTTGVAGLTLGGSLGWFARKYGLAHDNLRSVDLVTADGELVRASDETNPDLFWGIRGSGGNFGIVTSFEFELHQVGPEVWAGSVHHRLEDAEAALRFLRDFMREVPDEVQANASFWRVSEDPRFLSDVNGETILTINAFYGGTIEDGEDALGPIAEFGDPILVEFTEWRYAAWQQRSGRRHYWKSHYFEELSDQAIAAMVEHITPFLTPDTVAFFDWMGGAIGRVDPDLTAFPDRDKEYALTVAPRWDNPTDDASCIEWARAFHDSMRQHAAEGEYANYLNADDEAMIEAAYHGQLDRLVALKNEWDSDNRFRMNQNIEPSV
ncbi:FAD-binding oxidoreductase [Natronococcus jeotgali]|uniref:FAD linked oxidase-like protein n=1 Tax=Natronococcus jeotgali DSM 18795 TaxID=1227498 RepID=L9XNB4_9EURY|nr:FAD linked oxidase-like protein [Natronococcus jeotgali DSM 18795]